MNKFYSVEVINTSTGAVVKTINGIVGAIAVDDISNKLLTLNSVVSGYNRVRIKEVRDGQA